MAEDLSCDAWREGASRTKRGRFADATCEFSDSNRLIQNTKDLEHVGSLGLSSKLPPPSARNPSASVAWPHSSSTETMLVDCSRRRDVNVFITLQARALLGASRFLHRGMRPWCCPRLSLESSLEAHTGCVNTLSWRHDGLFLATGSDDTRVCIWNYQLGLRSVAKLHTGHSSNIFCTKFLGQTLLASGSNDQTVRVIDVHAERVLQIWEAHGAAVQNIVTDITNENRITSCGDDGQVCEFDLRAPRQSRSLIDWRARWCDGGPVNSYAMYGINSMANCALNPHLLVIAGADPCVWVYDRRALRPLIGPQPPLCVFRPVKIPLSSATTVTGVAMSPNGRHIVASWSGEHIYEFNISDGKPGACQQPTPFFGEFIGHSNRRTIKEVAYMGALGELIASGSDDGRLFVWSAITNQISFIGDGADAHVVNAVDAHPHDLCIASSGIDNSVKIWVPSASKPQQLQDEHLEQIIANNERDLAQHQRLFPLVFEDDTDCPSQ